MKTKKFNKKLVLNKKTIAKLSGSVMGNVNGGEELTIIQTNCLQCPTHIECTNGTRCETCGPYIC
jgi:hypothetical protein